MFRSRSQRTFRTALTALACTSLLSIGGCNIIAPIAIATAPEPEVKAQYLLSDRPTVVFLDDRSNFVTPSALRRVIADRVIENLMVQQIITPDNAIRSRDALAVAQATDKDGELLSIAGIGEAVGAEQIIYVRVEAFTSTVDGYKPQPGGGMLVKVIDVANNTRLFPAPETEQTAVTVTTIGKAVSQEMYASRVAQRQIFEMLALEMGDDVAELFYDHRPDDVLGSSLQPPPR